MHLKCLTCPAVRGRLLGDDNQVACHWVGQFSGGARGSVLYCHEPHDALFEFRSNNWILIPSPQPSREDIVLDLQIQFLLEKI